MIEVWFIRLKHTFLSLSVLQHYFSLLGSWSGQKEWADSASARSCEPCTVGRTQVQPSVSKTPNLITPAFVHSTPFVPSIRIISRGADHPESYGAAAQLDNSGRLGADIKAAACPIEPGATPTKTLISYQKYASGGRTLFLHPYYPELLHSGSERRGVNRKGLRRATRPPNLPSSRLKST